MKPVVMMHPLPGEQVRAEFLNWVSSSLSHGAKNVPCLPGKGKEDQ